jgi:ABC-2 type transport system permease protein
MTTTLEPVESAQPAGREPSEAEHLSPVRHPWSLVARREIATKLVDRTFLLGTFVTIAIITGFVVV